MTVGLGSTDIILLDVLLLGSRPDGFEFSAQDGTVDVIPEPPALALVGIATAVSVGLFGVCTKKRVQTCD
jgi:hypothetical protein